MASGAPGWRQCAAAEAPGVPGGGGLRRRGKRAACGAGPARKGRGQGAARSQASDYLAQSLEKRGEESPLPPQPRNTQRRGTVLYKKNLLSLAAQMGPGTSPLLDWSVTFQRCAMFHLPSNLGPILGEALASPAGLRRRGVTFRSVGRSR